MRLILLLTISLLFISCSDDITSEEKISVDEIYFSDYSFINSDTITSNFDKAIIRIDTPSIIQCNIDDYFLELPEESAIEAIVFDWARYSPMPYSPWYTDTTYNLGGVYRSNGYGRDNIDSVVYNSYSDTILFYADTGYYYFGVTLNNSSVDMKFNIMSIDSFIEEIDPGEILSEAYSLQLGNEYSSYLGLVEYDKTIDSTDSYIFEAQIGNTYTLNITSKVASLFKKVIVTDKQGNIQEQFIGSNISDSIPITATTDQMYIQILFDITPSSYSVTVSGK